MRDENLGEDHEEERDGKEELEAKWKLFGVLVVVIMSGAVDFSQRNK